MHVRTFRRITKLPMLPQSMCVMSAFLHVYENKMLITYTSLVSGHFSSSSHQWENTRHCLSRHRCIHVHMPTCALCSEEEPTAWLCTLLWVVSATVHIQSLYFKPFLAPIMTLWLHFLYQPDIPMVKFQITAVACLMKSNHFRTNPPCCLIPQQS